MYDPVYEASREQQLPADRLVRGTHCDEQGYEGRLRCRHGCRDPFVVNSMLHYSAFPSSLMPCGWEWDAIERGMVIQQTSQNPENCQGFFTTLQIFGDKFGSPCFGPPNHQ